MLLLWAAHSGNHSILHAKQTRWATALWRNQAHFVLLPHCIAKPCLFTLNNLQMKFQWLALVSPSKRQMADWHPGLLTFNQAISSSQWVRLLCHLPLWDLHFATTVATQRKANSSSVPKKSEPSLPVYLVFSWENADYFKQCFRIFFLFFEMEDLILLKTYFFSQECPWSNSAKTLTPVGRAESPVEEL